MDGISMFCDDTRDSIKGSVFIAAEGGYVNGKSVFQQEYFPRQTAGWTEKEPMSRAMRAS